MRTGQRGCMLVIVIIVLAEGSTSIVPPWFRLSSGHRELAAASHPDRCRFEAARVSSFCF